VEDYSRKFYDRTTLVLAGLTLLILSFYSLVLGIAYLVLFVCVTLVVKKKNVCLTTAQSGWRNLEVIVVSIFLINVIIESCLQIYPHLLKAKGGMDTLADFSDYTSRGYLTEKVFKKNKENVRVLGLGDSFAVYLRDEGKNYHDFLQKRFQMRSQEAVEVVNAGMIGIGPGYYWHILKKYGDLFKPDVVIVGFFVGNDFEEGELFVRIGDLVVEPYDSMKKFSKYYTFYQTRLYKFLKTKFIRYREEQRRAKEKQQVPAEQMGVFSTESFLEVEKSRSWIFHKHNRQLLEKKWRECAGPILNIKQWCDARGIKFLLVIFPSQFQVEEDLRGQVLSRYPEMAPDALAVAYPNQLITQFCRTHDINCLDLLPLFQAQGNKPSLYELKHTHWNAAGNQLAADTIFAYLEDHHLVPPAPRRSR